MNFAVESEATLVNDLAQIESVELPGNSEVAPGPCTFLVELTKVMGKTILFGNLLVALVLFISGDLYRPAIIPEFGSTFTELKLQMGEPQFEQASPLDEARIPRVPWFSSERNEWIEYTDLPLIKGKRVLYYAGVLGTHRVLIYLEDGKVVDVYESMT